MARLTFQQACVAAIAEEMRRDRNVFVMGEDIGSFGGPLASNKGLWEEFGAEGRVIDTPISESTFVGAAVGAAMQGKRPVVDLMFLEFLGLVMQQFMDAGAMHYYSGGTLKVPMVLRAKYGVGPFHGHAYDLHSWLVNLPGVKVVAPSNPADAKGLMRAAIRDDNPVLFLEHMALYHAGRAEVSDDPEFTVPLGTAAVARTGGDATIVASALMVKRALAAAETLAGTGIEAEVVDLRTIAPLDEETVLASVRKTGRLVVACEAIRTGSSANEVVAVAAEQAFDALKGPILRIAPPPIPVPFHRELEKAYLPDSADIVAAVRRLVAA
jgi:acetoin:2,6-dichlorophenolindophenol oxidoreductase subunit beta